jgi:acetylornithine deacetylase/succinyl-diaminopimelate desuccinylase-like protein
VTTSTALVEQLTARVDAVMADCLAALSDLIAVPSVSLPGSDQSQVGASAQLTAALFTDSGAPDVRILETATGHPTVYAHWPAPTGSPTVLLYAHHDVQPAAQEDGWTSPPFRADRRGGRIFGRGAADNKAGIAVHLAAVKALGPVPPVGVTVLVEGEEEIGSPGLPAFLDEHAELLAADAVLIADSASLRVGQPALTISLRGLIDAVIELRTLSGPLHSGVFGGVVPDALSAMTTLLASLYDEDGRVAIDDLKPQSADGLVLEGGELTRNAKPVAGVPVPSDAEAALRAWTQPALSVLGLDAPAAATAGNQLVPSARAKLSLRIPPGITPELARQGLQAHLSSHTPWGAELTIEPGQSVTPFRVDTDNDVFRLAESSFASAWGIDPIRIGNGGSIPAAAALASRFVDAPVILFGAADRTSRTHGVDESVEIDEIRRCALAEALLLAHLAHVTRGSKTTATPTSRRDAPSQI